ncbi:tetratricopeptide repeat protein [Seonamhaeicola marinus]|uniref:Uncharacterized protein n=1 Tax=Seonamhaeicola marinus TaxID=1912246 RepID=A0A5D0HF27_9FLAO|nr:hypothetical protein [Seonamhaeicola marinus]TYA69978.1 hypothetical protein FUA24_22070 [Seonamhaeicola marinus]
MENQLQKAKELRQEKKFDEAVVLYEQLYEGESVVFNHWDIWSYVHSLKNCGQLDKSIELSERYVEGFPDFELIKNNLVWAYFDKYIRNFNSDFIVEIERALNRIHELNGQQEVSENNNIPCPFTIGVFKVLKHFRRPNFNLFKTRYWIDKISPEKLSRREQSIEQNGVERKLASDFEKYYSYLISLQYGEGAFEECIKSAELALETITNFHYNNANWFKRRMALSYFELGELEKAEEILKPLDKGTNEKWFIEYELSQIYFEQGNFDKSLEFALKAAKNFGDDFMKVNLFTHLARIFYKQDKFEYAKEHAQLVICIKKDNGSQLDSKQEKLIAFFKLDKNSSIGLREQKKIVEDIWNDLLFDGQPMNHGIISKILPNGKAGFISLNDSRESYYFSFQSIKQGRRFAKEGKSVSFFLKEGFDKKKNEIKMNACEIIVLKN